MGDGFYADRVEEVDSGMNHTRINLRRCCRTGYRSIVCCRILVVCMFFCPWKLHRRTPARPMVVVWVRVFADPLFGAGVPGDENDGAVATVSNRTENGY